MNVNIGEYYEAKLRAIISRGVASNKTEALRMAINAYERQLEEEHEQMVLERIEKDYAKMDKTKFISFDELLKEAKIDKNKL